MPLALIIPARFKLLGILGKPLPLNPVQKNVPVVQPDWQPRVEDNRSVIVKKLRNPRKFIGIAVIDLRDLLITLRIRIWILHQHELVRSETRDLLLHLILGSYNDDLPEQMVQQA